MHNDRAGWLCKCECGDEIAVSTSDLSSGRVISCGYCAKAATDLKRAQAMIGQHFGNLVVKELLPSKGKGFYYHCQCDCGGEITTLGISLRNGNTKSCGHCSRKEAWARNREDITGQTFGYLTVKKYLYSQGHHSFWECECKCGNTCATNGTLLKSGGKKSCGCLHSIGEANITRILQDNHILFTKQWTTDNLLSEKKYHLYYDFAILDKEEKVVRLIEFDGEQHFYPIDRWFGGEKEFEKIHSRDMIKNQYALDHNIPLIRIPYTIRDNITLNDILGNKYIIPEQKELL